MARRDRQRKKILILVGFVLVLVVAGVGAMQLKNIRQARMVDQKRESGLLAHEEGRHEEAFRDLQYVVRKTPDDVEVTIALIKSRRAVPMVNNRHLVQAMQFARRGSEIAPDSIEIHELLMSMYGEAGLLTERLVAAQEVQRLDPDHRDAIWVEIDSLRLLGQRDDAYAKARDFYDRFPDDPDAAGAVVDLMVATGQDEDTIIAFVDQAAEDHTDVVSVHQLQARVYGLFGRIEEARAAALRVAEMDQPDSSTLAATIQLLDVLGETDTVESLLERESDDGDGSDMATVVAASRAWKDARLIDAVRRLEASNRPVEDSSADLLAWQAVILDEAHAGPAVEELRARESNEAQAWIATLDARTHIRAGRWSEAANAARRALELDPRNELAMFLLGETERAVGDWRTAVERWRAMRIGEPRWLTLRLDIISALLGAGQSREAYTEAVQTIIEWPDRLVAAEALARTGVTLMENGQATASERTQLLNVLTQIEQQASDPVVGLALLTRAYAAMGDDDAARSSLERLLAFDRLPAPIDLVPLVESCRRNEIYGVSELVARASADGIEDPGMVLAAAMVAHQNGRTKEGEALIDESLRGANAESRKQMALQRVRAVYFDQTNDSRALDALKDVATTHREDPECQLALLNSRAAWTDREAVRSAIAALRDASGEESVAWKVFEARETLTFEPTEKEAAQVVQLLQDVIRREPDNVGALTYLGEAYAILKDYTQASRMLGRAVDEQAANPMLVARLIELLQLAGASDEAETRLRAFAAIDGLTEDQRSRRAQLLLRQNLLDLARRDLDALAASGDIEFVSLAAQAAARSGDVSSARTAFNSVLERPDRTVDSVVAAADFMARFDGFDQGLAALELLPAANAGIDHRLIRAAFHQRHGRVAEADRLYASLAAETDDPQAWIALVRLRSARNDGTGAYQAVQQALASHPNNESLKMLEYALNPGAEATPTQAILRIVDSLDPEDANREPLERYLVARRAIDQRPNDPAFAEDQLRRVVDEFPTFYPAWKELAEMLSNAGLHDEAATVAREAAYRIPTEADAAELATRALAIAGRYDEALPMAEEWSARLDDDPYPAQLFTAVLLREMGRNTDALGRIEPWADRIVLEADQSPTIVIMLASLMALDGRIEEAGEVFDPLIASDVVWASRRLGVVTQLMSQPTLARDWVERWASTLPDDPDAAAALGNAMYNVATATGDSSMLERAIEPLTEALESSQHRLLAATMLAGAYEQLGNFAEAERHYRIALDENANEAVVLNNLAYLLVRTGGSSEEAVELARRCVQIAESQASAGTLLVNYLDTLGTALLYAERFDEAAGVFDRAVQLAPDNVGILLGLAEARLGDGDEAGAQDALSRLLILRDRGRISDDAQRDRLAQILERSGA